MKLVQKAIALMGASIQGKDVLEVACGCAEFSLCAANTAKSVVCIDIVDKRLPPKIAEHENITFELMDATRMAFPDESFDTVVLYNAIGHLYDIVGEVLAECERVRRKGGHIYIASSISMDKRFIDDTLLCEPSGALTRAKKLGDTSLYCFEL